MSEASPERISADMKQAMRDRDALRRDTLRMLLAGIKNREIELGRELEEGELLEVLRRSVKTRQDSVEQFQAAGRQELADKERAEIAVIQAYLPRQLDEEGVRELVAALVAELGLQSRKDVGRLMKELMARHRGEIDGRTASRIAGELLAP